MHPLSRLFSASLLAVLLGCAAQTSDREAGELVDDGYESGVPEPDSLLHAITVGSPLDSLAVDIPDLPDSALAEERERVEDEGPSFDIPVDFNVRVMTFIDAYSGKRADWTARALTRSGAWLPMIREIFAEEGVPLDLAYMAMIESGYRHNARSRVGAIGMWQFMRGTARRYGLLCNSFVDERLDPERATRAAARYLRDLHEEFGHWHLAMAAYNSGEGRVRRAIRRAGTRDFWEIAGTRHLPRETRNFVPAILAAAVIGKSPEKFGFGEVVPNDPIPYEKVEVPSVTHVDVIARCCSVTGSEIRALNPALISLQTPPGHHPYEVRVPVGTTAAFLTALADIPPDERMLYLRHRIHRGETLGRISRRYGTTVAAIQQANHMGRTTMIREGKTLLIPTTGAADPGLFMGSLAAQGEQVTHRLRRGETLSHVARAYGTTVKAIQLWNHLSNPHQVREGQSLVVYAGVRQAAPKNQTDAARTPRPTARAADGDRLVASHTVQRGQTLWAISRAYGMSMAELRALNPRLGRVIHPGDRVKVHARTDGQSLVHEVLRGETLWDIADRYNTTVANIRSWNGMSGNQTLIRPGDRLSIIR